MGIYHIFLSCEDDILIKSEALEKFLKTLLDDGQTTDIKCIKKHKNLELSREEFDDLIGSSIYVVNTHEDLDYITSWELGYAMGKGLTIIGFFDGNSAMKIPPDVEGLIRPIPPNVDLFVNKINRALVDLKPKEFILKDDYNKLRQSAKKEAEATS